MTILYLKPAIIGISIYTFGNNFKDRGQIDKKQAISDDLFGFGDSAIERIRT